MVTHSHTPAAGEHHGLIHLPRVYHVGTWLLHLGRRGRVYARIARDSGAQPGQRVLDLGCGTGVLTRALAEVVGPAGSVVGIDPAHEIVEFARRSAPAQVRFEVMGAKRLDFPDASFDLVASSLAWHHIPPEQRPAAAAEIRRVLRPGGSVMIFDLTPPRSGLLRRLVGAITPHHADHDPIVDLPPTLRDAGLEVTDVMPHPPFAVAVHAQRH